MERVEEVQSGAPTRPWKQLSLAVVAVGVLFVVLHGFGIVDPGGVVTFPAAAVVAVGATVVGLRWWRPRPVWPWYSFGIALALLVVAMGLRVSLGTLGDLGPGRSFIPDLIAIPGYVCLAVGLAGLAGVGLRNADDVDAILDGVIAALAVLLLAWVLLVSPVLAKQDIATSAQITMAVYPVMSAFVFSMGARAAFSRGRRAPAAMLLYLGAMFALMVGDTLYAVVDADLYEVPLYVVDVPYVIALLVYAVATLHPSIRELGQSRTSDDVAAGKGRLLSVVVALCLPIAVLLFADRNAATGNRIALGVIAVLLVGVGVFRMWRALRQHARSQARLAHEATHDSLTGLPNRILLREEVARSLRSQRDDTNTVALLHVDIDRFKLVNDTMGHAQGDALLLAVAERLLQRVRTGDLVGRLGGDEFLVVVAGLDDEAAAVEFGARTRMMFREPFTVGDTVIQVTASVGVAFSAGGDAAAEELLRDADTALNHAKAQGGDDAAVFDSSMRERVAERLQLERELRTALAREELLLHFQPKLRLGNGKVVGLEALLRWQHPELGMIPPDKFIGVAEDTGMIVEIGAWVVDRAAAELARLQKTFRHTSGLCMSVNVSARQLRSDTLVDTIAQALLRHGIPPETLCLELTESILMENLDLVTPQLEAIRECGTKVSIDDFGTGYSSLAYLTRLSVDELKIDRSFVRDLGTETGSSSLVQAVVFIASSLGITTVAEGVETQAQADELRALGCNEVQGFLYARPVPSGELDAKLVELGMVPTNHLRVVPARTKGSLGHTA